jgi:DNA-binding response OmpR family regulator
MLSILKKHSILYVEDEPEIQANIAEYLGNYFTEIHLASDGQEALDQYNKYHPDVLLLDINLPKVEGLTVAKEIREQDDSVKIIMLTAFTEKEKLLKATELKLTKYLIKPVPPKEFKATLEMLANELMSNPSHFLHLSEDCIWDSDQEQLIHNNRPIVLAEKEHRLLKLFINRKGKLVSYEKIMLAVWEDAFDREISIDSVKNQVSQLRKKLPRGCIASVYGEGYTLK